MPVVIRRIHIFSSYFITPNASWCPRSLLVRSSPFFALLAFGPFAWPVRRTRKRRYFGRYAAGWADLLFDPAGPASAGLLLFHSLGGSAARFRRTTEDRVFICPVRHRFTFVGNDSPIFAWATAKTDTGSPIRILSQA